MTFTLGYTTTPSGSYNFTGLNTGNQLAWKITIPGGGADIISISAYFAAEHGHGNTTACMCLWNASGGLLATTPTFTITPGSGGIGGQTLYTGTFSSLITGLTVGANYYVGWWRAPSGTQEWTENSSSLTEWLTTNTSGSPGNLGSNLAGPGQPEIFATCSTPVVAGGIKIWNISGDSQWHKYKCKTWNTTVASAWTWNPIRVWNGSAWIHNA